MDEWFRDDAACREYIRRLRWPNGFICPHCGVAASLGRCRKAASVSQLSARTSLTAGTMFQDTRKPLRTWFLAMWFVTSQKNGVSALGLQRVLGLGSYETAWTWLHKLRRAMVRPGRDCLSGTVEVDETYVGGPEEGQRGPGDRGQSHCRGSRRGERPGDRPHPPSAHRGRVRGQPSSLRQSAIAPGAVVHTDGWRGYSGLAKAGYQHQVTIISAGSDPAHEVMPRVHMVASLLKRWLLGTHQGGVQRQHLDYYLDEFTFRFNRRRSNARGLLFHRLAQQAVAVEPAPYRTIIGVRKSSHPQAQVVKGIPIFKIFASSPDR